MARSSKRGRVKLSATAYKELLQVVYSRDNWKCRLCGSRNNLNAHHIKFRSQGGNDEDTNLITLCLGCHSAVHERKLEIKAKYDKGSELSICFEFKFKNGWTCAT